MSFKKLVACLFCFLMLFLQGFALAKAEIKFENFKKFKPPQNHLCFLKEKQDGGEFSGVYYLIDEKKLEKKENIVGQMLVYKKGQVKKEDIIYFFNAKKIKSETLPKNNIKIDYFYSNKLSLHKKAGELIFNLQLIFLENETLLCYPINFASF